MKTKHNNILRTVGLAAALWAVVLSITLSTQAATQLTTSISGLTAFYEKGSVGDAATWAVSDNQITGSAKTTGSSSGCGTNYTQSSGILTLQNTGFTAANLSFDVSVKNLGTVIIDGATYTNNGSFGKILAKNESIQVELTSKSDSAVTTEVILSNISLKEENNVSVTFVPVSGIDYQVGSTTVSEATGALTLSGSNTTAYTITASNSNYHFVSAPWKTTDENGTVTASGTLTPNVSGNVTPTDTCTITPMFVYDDNGIAPFLVGSTNYWSWETAFTAGVASTVILTDEYTLPQNLSGNGLSSSGTYVTENNGSLTYIIPKGTTFLIPYDDAHTLCTTKPTVDNSIDVDAKYSNPTAYRTLTMGSGTNILVNGDMSLSGTHCANMCSGTFNGAPIGKLGFVDMQENSNITVSGGANLYVWGYITGGGTVTIKSNGTVYEDFQITDYRGGNATSGMKDNSYRVFPLSQYYVQNVQVPMTLEAGAAENGYMSVDVSYVGKQSATVPFIGSGAMFQIQSGSITKDYNEENDRLEIDVNGTLLMSNYKINIKVAVLGDVELKTENYVLPVNGNITVNVASGSTLKIAQDISLYPGAIIDIAPEARCELINGASIYVYDLDQWGGYCGAANRKICPVVYAPGRQKTRGESDLVDAQIIVNGTLDATNGYIYTTTSGGNICSTGTGTAIIAAKSDATLYQAIQTGNAIEDSGWISIGISSAKLRNEDGNYVETSATTYRYAHHGSGGKWYPGEHVIKPTVTLPDCTNSGSTLYSCVCGHSYTGDVQNALGHDMKAGTVTPPTCTAGGYTTYTCSRCGLTEQRDKTPAGSHSYSSAVTTEPSCTAEGIRTYTCGACGHSYTESIPKTDHNYESVTADPTCTEEGYTTHTCTACGDSYTSDTIAALGHGWDAGIVTTEPTCTEAGVRTFTCGVCGETKTETISNTGHSYSVTDEKAATCEEDGYTVYTCAACGDTYTDTHLQTGHDWEDGVCQNDNSHQCPGHNFDPETDICSICKLGCNHESWTAGEVVEPTCTEDGYTVYTCDLCHKEKHDDIVPTAGHSWKDATCTTPKTCSACGATEGGTLDHTPGEAQKENEVLPTCVNGGSYDLVIRCTVCKEVLESTHCTTDATGSHTYGDWATTTEATYNSFAIQTRTCTVCQTATETQHPDSAKIGETAYPTLSQAVDQATEGRTITLLVDISGDCVISKALTVEKNGHTANIIAGDGYMADGDTTITIWKLFKLAGTSVKVEDGLHIFFYVNDADKKDGYVAHITRTKLVKDSSNNYTVEATETAEPIPSSAWSSYSGGQLWRFSYDGIAAKEMTDIVTVIIRDSSGKQVSAVATESIEGYALRTLEKIKDQQNLRNAVISMVNYGADAQTHFGYRTLETDHLANANLTGLSDAEMALDGKTVTATDHTKSDGSIGLGGTTVTAEANLYLTFYFKDITETKDNLTACISYTDHYNRTETITIPGSSFVSVKNSDGDTLYGPRVTGIAMADGRALITCELKDGDTTLATAVSSVESYAAYNLEHSANEALKAVCNNMINFVDYVKAYFDNPKA